MFALRLTKLESYFTTTLPSDANNSTTLTLIRNQNSAFNLYVLPVPIVTLKCKIYSSKFPNLIRRSYLHYEGVYTKLLSTLTDYRLPTLYESPEYEVTGFRMALDALLFNISDFDQNNFAPISTLTEIPFEQEVNHNLPQKRLLKQRRLIYRKDDLTGLLPPGTVQTLSIPGTDYQLCFTPGLLSSV